MLLSGGKGREGRFSGALQETETEIKGKQISLEFWSNSLVLF